VFAWYNVLQDAGHAFGGLVAGMPLLFHRVLGWSDIQGTQVTFALLGLVLAVSTLLYRGLSPAVEAHAKPAEAPVPVESRRVVRRISLLFLIDSLAGGFLGTALLSYFFFERFGVSEAMIGALFFGARTLNAFSHFAAAWLAARIGLVNTMVFTHIPSSLLLVTVGFAPSFGIAAIFFLLREGLVEMDVPARQSYVMAVVAPEARTYASGITHLTRMAGWAVGPLFAGALMSGATLAAPLYLGAALKIGYDLALWVSFRHIKPPEEW
jgi:predicted MFS family arabinose efflux permease